MNIENNEIYDVCLFAELVAKNSNKILFINFILNYAVLLI